MPQIASQGGHTTGVEGSSIPSPTAAMAPGNILEEEGENTIDESLEGRIPSTTPMPQIASQGGHTTGVEGSSIPSPTAATIDESLGGRFTSTAPIPQEASGQTASAPAPLLVMKLAPRQAGKVYEFIEWFDKTSRGLSTSVLTSMKNPNISVVMNSVLTVDPKTLLQKLEPELSKCYVGKWRYFKQEGGTSEFRETGPRKHMLACDKIKEHLKFDGKAKSGAKLGTERSYWIDLSLANGLPGFYHYSKSVFLHAAEMLPGGRLCMMHHLPQDTQATMEPLLFIGQPPVYTALHADGNGTVDSAHLCLKGHNEVFILPRLGADMTSKALSVLEYPEAFTSKPHQLSQKGGAFKWPTIAMAEKLKKDYGITASILILEPGQMVHLNKGCFHCFRKLSIMPLPDTNVHASLRNALVQRKGLKYEELCISVAWDWLYTGTLPPRVYLTNWCI
jgi:hypothetical protein